VGPARKPSTQYIATSFRQDFCLRDSRRMRDMVLSPWYQQNFPHVELVATGEWRFSNTQGGFREAVPFGSLTGGKADCILIEDLNKLKESDKPPPMLVDEDGKPRLDKNGKPLFGSAPSKADRRVVAVLANYAIRAWDLVPRPGRITGH